MIITYNDICSAFSQSLAKIKNDEYELNEEVERFRTELMATLYMPVLTFEERVFDPVKKTSSISKKDRIEFIMVNDTTDEYSSLDTLRLKLYIDIALHIGTNALSPDVQATIRKRVMLQNTAHAYLYQVDLKRFEIQKTIETERYDALFYYIKKSLYNQCLYK